MKDDDTDKILGITRCARCGHRLEGDDPARIAGPPQILRVLPGVAADVEHDVDAQHLEKARQVGVEGIEPGPGADVESGLVRQAPQRAQNSIHSPTPLIPVRWPRV